MVRTVKRERIEQPRGDGRSRRVEEPIEPPSSGGRKRRIEEQEGVEHRETQGEGDVLGRRILRSRYLQVKHRISDETHDMTKVDPDKFKSIIKEVDNLHEQVQKPREQVADAEALLDITNTLVTSVRAQCHEGLTPVDFINCLLKDFRQQGGPSTSCDGSSSSIRWKDIGLAVSHIFSIAPGCSTMVGPMNTEIKTRKVAPRKKHTKLAQKATPEELENTAVEEKTDTDRNMATMFDILKRYKKPKLENLVLNRISFAQTVENIFALSFLVKDGRAEITVDEHGRHLVSPRNAPASSAVTAKQVSYSHFVFRFDFRDWKLMMTCVADGEELMPHRNTPSSEGAAQPDEESPETQTVLPTTPIRKFSRNRGLIMQEPAVVEDSPESGEPAAARTAAIRKGKRKAV